LESRRPCHDHHPRLLPVLDFSERVAAELFIVAPRSTEAGVHNGRLALNLLRIGATGAAHGQDARDRAIDAMITLAIGRFLDLEND
jgi:hypothetical protein